MVDHWWSSFFKYVCMMLSASFKRGQIHRQISYMHDPPIINSLTIYLNEATPTVQLNSSTNLSYKLPPQIIPHAFYPKNPLITSFNLC